VLGQHLQDLDLELGDGRLGGLELALVDHAGAEQRS
jgi:hypothetical protein